MHLDRPQAQDPYVKLPTVPSFTLTSTDISHGKPMAAQFSAAGGNESPQLSWSGFPATTRGFVVTCFDADAPTPSGWWHWAVVDLSPDITELDQGAGASDLMLPGAGMHLRNDDGEHAYTGAAPPRGDREHRYYFAVHALDTETLELDDDVSLAKASMRVLGHTVGRAVLMATFKN